jgi:hypothetical protein
MLSFSVEIYLVFNGFSLRDMSEFNDHIQVSH